MKFLKSGSFRIISHPSYHSFVSFLKLFHHYLDITFLAVRITDEGSLPETCKYGPFLKFDQFINDTILFEDLLHLHYLVSVTAGGPRVPEGTCSQVPINSF